MAEFVRRISYEKKKRMAIFTVGMTCNTDPLLQGNNGQHYALFCLRVSI